MPRGEHLVEFRNRSRKWLRGMIHWPVGPKSPRALARAGVASLRFDFYGSGESEGEFREVTLQGEIADAEDAVRFLRRQKGIDVRRVGLSGISLGGCVAACVAQRVRARALVLWSAVAHPELLHSLAEKASKPILGGKGAVEYDAREVSPKFLRSLSGVKPLPALRQFKQPTLIIHPEKDESVPLSHAEDLFRAAGAEAKKKLIIPGADHVFTSLAWECEVIGKTVEWFQMYL